MGIRSWIQARREEIRRGKIVTEQMKADKLRRKGNRLASLEPGTIRYGLIHKQHPLELMEEAKQRRKNKREEKKH